MLVVALAALQAGEDAGQLGVTDPSVIKLYAQRSPTQHEHAAEIRAAYGYREFADPAPVWS